MSERMRGGHAASDIDLLEEIVRLSRGGCVSALATVVESSGSSPRKVGAKMLVRGDGSIMGTVGGGAVEQEVIAASLAATRDGRPRMATFELTERYGHVCGGTMRVYLEPNRIEPRLLVVGAGHVGSALAVLARFAGFHVTVIDEREEYACRQRLPDANRIVAAAAADALPALDVSAATAIVIATAGFEQDFAAVRSALKTAAGYIGMIGSKRKRAVLEETLAGEGYHAQEIARVTSPVGLEIGAETPQEIAVSIMAQLIAFRSGNGKYGVGNRTGGGRVAPDGDLQAAAAACGQTGDPALP